jgi:hypothetical protein
MVAIDPAPTMKHGPVEMAPARHLDGVLPNEAGVIDSDVVAKMEFEPCLVESGDMVFFCSYAPHRSTRNDTEHTRRLAYLTYNPLGEGDLHGPYYRKKHEAMASGGAGSISINKDFGGSIVS